MSDQNKPGIFFWMIAALFLIWNAFGCYLYIIDVTLADAAYAEKYGEAMAAVRAKYPAWSIAAYAIAVWGGLLASLLLLLRKGLALPLFTLSLIAAAISFIWGLTNAEAKAAAGAGAWIMPVVVILIGAFEIWWTRRQKSRGRIG